MAPFLIYPIFLMELSCMALFACAFNLLIGGGGLLSFGHAAFFGGGAYIAAETAKAFGFSFELAMLSGIASATVLGFLFGIIAIRRQGLIFAMVTLALAQAVYFLALRLPFTNSEDGIQAVSARLANLASSTSTTISPCITSPRRFFWPDIFWWRGCGNRRSARSCARSRIISRA